MISEKFLYWTYFLSDDGSADDIIPSFFNIPEYHSKYLFLHVRPGISFNFEKDQLLTQLSNYTFEIDKLEEDYILDEMGVHGKLVYNDILKQYGFGENYKLYAVSISPESVSLIKKLFNSVKI